MNIPLVETLFDVFKLFAFVIVSERFEWGHLSINFAACL
jgi:hypothetical protein